MPRRRTGVLLPLEMAILELACRRLEGDDPWLYGFALASELAGPEEGRRLLGHGTLYKALDRLERDQILESKWEDIAPSDEGRPRRRLYRATPAAAPALARSRALQPAPAPAPRWLPA